jgi:hypothetical protein
MTDGIVDTTLPPKVISDYSRHGRESRFNRILFIVLRLGRKLFNPLNKEVITTSLYPITGT